MTLLRNVAWLVTLVALAPLVSAAQAPTLPHILADPAVIAAEPLPDFSYAGYRFGLAPLPNDPGQVIEATAYGVTPDDGKDDAKACPPSAPVRHS
jgi:hypothetical protein